MAMWNVFEHWAAAAAAAGCSDTVGAAGLSWQHVTHRLCLLGMNRTCALTPHWQCANAERYKYIGHHVVGQHVQFGGGLA